MWFGPWLYSISLSFTQWSQNKKYNNCLKLNIADSKEKKQPVPYQPTNMGWSILWFLLHSLLNLEKWITCIFSVNSQPKMILNMTLKTINLSDMYYFSSPKTCPQALILFLYYYVYWHSRPIWIVKTLSKTSWGEVETRSMMRCLLRCDAVWVSWLKKLLKVTGTIDIMLSKYIIHGTWFYTTYGLKKYDYY